jgi:hypothetical protein
MMVSYNFGFLLPQQLLEMYTTVGFMVVDTQDMRAAGKDAFSAFGGCFKHFFHFFSHS